MWAIWLFGLFLMESPFVEGTVEDVLNKAEKENKLVFVDVYTDWCGPCKLLDKTTFTDQKVMEALSNKVISFKINAEKGEGIALARKYKVMGYPCFLLLNGKGELVNRSFGYMPPQTFLHWLENAI